LKTKKWKLLFIAGLFATKAINARFVERAKDFFGVTRDEDVISIDLQGCKSKKQAVEYVKAQLMILGENVIIIGHSAGAQLATRFIGHTSVALVVPIEPPSHSPLDFPLFLWSSTTKYLRKTLSNMFFRPTDADCIKLFGRTIPRIMRGDSWGRLIMQMNFGWLVGNGEPVLPRRGLCLFVATTGDKLITAKSVRRTAEDLGGEFLLLDHPDHYPHVGLEGEANISLILEEAGRILTAGIQSFEE